MRDLRQAAKAVVAVCCRADSVCANPAGIPGDRRDRVVAPVGVDRNLLDGRRGRRPNGRRGELAIAGNAVESVVGKTGLLAEPSGRWAVSPHHGHRRLILPRGD